METRYHSVQGANESTLTGELTDLLLPVLSRKQSTVGTAGCPAPLAEMCAM